MSLPQCSIEYPSCGACGGSTEHDGDSFVCYDCRLNYGNGGDGNEAEFIDDEQPPCGKPCDNNWHRIGIEHRGQRIFYDCEPCKLPKGHLSMCWTDCKDKP